MPTIGDTVVHKSFGVGVIIAQTDRITTIEFTDYGEKKFPNISLDSKFFNHEDTNDISQNVELMFYNIDSFGNIITKSGWSRSLNNEEHRPVVFKNNAYIDGATASLRLELPYSEKRIYEMCEDEDNTKWRFVTEEDINAYIERT